MSAPQYYSDNYSTFKDIVVGLDPDDAVSIRDCQEVLRNPLLVSKLVFIKTHLMFLKYGILKLEEHGTDLKSQLEVISNIKDRLPNSKVSEKLKIVLEKNVGYNTISQILKKCLMENQVLDSQQNFLQAKFLSFHIHLSQAAM